MIKMIKRRLIRENGVTLLEIIIVVSIVGILIVALGFSFQGWLGSYRIENQIKEIHTDLLNARVRAMDMKRMYYADFPAVTQFRVREDTDENYAPGTLAGDTILPTFPKTYNDFPVTWAGGTIAFDSRGIIQPTTTPIGGTICIFSGAISAAINPDYDCIVISETRMNLGKIINQGVGCNADNCTLK